MLFFFKKERKKYLEKIFAQLFDTLSLLYMTIVNRHHFVEIDRSTILYYFRQKYLENPQNFYFENFKIPKIRKEFLKSFKEYNLYQINFESPIFTPFPENNLFWGKYFKLKKKSRGTVIILHGWRIKNYIFFEDAAKKFLDMGIESILVDLPYHLHRRPRFSYDGEYMISSNGIQTLQSIKQAIAETKILIDWLRKQNIKNIGVFGVSLGSWLSALLCGLIHPPLKFAILVSPPANPEKMFYKSRLANLLKNSQGKVERLFEKFKKVLKIINPLYLKPLIDRENILVIESIYDMMVPKEIVEEFCEKWGLKNILRYKQGHLSVLFFEKNLFSDIEKFLKNVI
jgi:pimeloyl-ACP methyl ester carboxylesterase